VKTKLLKMARRLWNTGDRRLDRRNQLEWVRAVHRLGDKWLLAAYQPRKTSKI